MDDEPCAAMNTRTDTTEGKPRSWLRATLLALGAVLLVPLLLIVLFFALIVLIGVPVEPPLTRAEMLLREERFAEEALASPDLGAPLYFHSDDRPVYYSSVAQFDLPMSLKRRFGARHLDPLRESVLGRSRIDWSATPIPESHEEYFDFALAKDLGIFDAGRQEQIDRIRGLTSRPGAYLSFLYTNFRTRPSDLKSIEVFVVDLEQRKLYVAKRYWQR
jgi:hypothetical protein